MLRQSTVWSLSAPIALSIAHALFAFVVGSNGGLLCVFFVPYEGHPAEEPTES